ncbi:MAG: ATP-binding protein [Pseudomonadota bacterium]|nr:ATP-binding protein [Pseudomonadota bacterium]
MVPPDPASAPASPPPGKPPAQRFGRLFGRPRLSTLLLAVNLILLIAPLSGVFAMRLYESALLRQTESALLSQTAFIAASYRAALERNRTSSLDGGGLSHPVDPAFEIDSVEGEPWRPRPPVLDLARDKPLPPAPPPRRTPSPTHWLSEAVGKDISPVIVEAHHFTLSSIRVLDHRGTIVASTAENVGQSVAHLPEVERALRGEIVSLLREKEEFAEGQRGFNAFERSSGIRVHVAAPIILDNRVVGGVLLGRTPSTLRNALRSKVRIFIVGGVLLVVMAMALSLFLAATIVGPVSRLIHQAKQVADGRRSGIRPLRYPVTADIAELSEAVVAMANTLETRSAYIREFAANVSHEFKTPLTSIQGAVELLRDHAASMDEDRRARFLDNIAKDSDRLARLVTRLLELARADVMQPGGAGESRLAALLLDLQRHYADLGQSFGIEGADSDTGIGARGEDDIRVAMDGDNLASVVRNLIDNALHHGKGEPRLVIEPATAQVRLRVIDDGPGVSPANADRIFSAFFTTDREGGGTGLGLALVKTLVEVHGGHIRLADRAEGCEFVVTLPRLSGPVAGDAAS